MKIDFENITQSAKWFDENLFVPCYQRLGQVQNPAYLRLASPFIALGDGLISSAQTASGLGEALFKGVANAVYGVAYRDKAPLQKGALQIVLGGGAIALLSLPVIALRTLWIGANLAYSPSSALAEIRQKLSPQPQPLPVR